MRLAHSRFYQGTPVWKGQNFDRVVTTCWEGQGNCLKYAVAVFRKESKSAKWDKKLHRETAVKRFLETPVCVELSIGGSTKIDFHKLNGHAVDWYIATVLLPAFDGSSRFESKYQRVDITSYSYFNDQYTFFKLRELVSEKTNRETIRVEEPQQCDCAICFANRKTNGASMELSSVTTADLVTMGVVLAGLISVALYFF